MNTPYLAPWGSRSDEPPDELVAERRELVRRMIGVMSKGMRPPSRAEFDRLQARIKQAWEAADYGNEHGDSPRRTLDTVLRALGFPEPWG
jgi:hypothetical protein